MTDPLYENYWQRKQLLSEGCPTFSVIQTSGQKFDGDVLRLIATALKGKERVLDVGAGNLQIRDTLLATGLNPRYETLDIGREYEYSYSSLEQVEGDFDAILLMDVIEHLPLRDGLGLLQQLKQKLRAGGTLILQTPNGRCVRSPFSSDMTHVQSYTLPDLWAYLTCADFRTAGYRVAFQAASGLHSRVITLASRAVVTRLLGLDYADNILLIADKLL